MKKKHFNMLVAFAIINLILLIWQVYQIINHPISLIFIVIGILSLGFVSRSTYDHNNIFILGIVSLLIGFGVTGPFWAILLIDGIFIIVFIHHFFNHQGTADEVFPWENKQFIDVDLDDETYSNDANLQHNRLFGETIIGDSEDEAQLFKDVTLSLFAGDTIIDLGNKLIPLNKDNYVSLQKGFGKTRIIVPIGTEIQVNYSSIIGNFICDNTTISVKNSTLVKKLHENDSNRKVTIVVSSFIGDLEVIYL